MYNTSVLAVGNSEDVNKFWDVALKKSLRHRCHHQHFWAGGQLFDLFHGGQHGEIQLPSFHEMHRRVGLVVRLVLWSREHGFSTCWL